jgi:hypothetical protein
MVMIEGIGNKEGGKGKGEREKYFFFLTLYPLPFALSPSSNPH